MCTIHTKDCITVVDISHKNSCTITFTVHETNMYKHTHSKSNNGPDHTIIAYKTLRNIIILYIIL